MATVAILRTRDGVPSSADLATLLIRDATSTIVWPDQGSGYTEQTILPSRPGYYSAEVPLGAGTYTAYWTFSMAGAPDDHISRLFTLDQPVVMTDGVTLAQLERLVARRIGPYWRFPAGEGSNVLRLFSTRLKSSLSLGSYEDQFMLRRGLTVDNLLIPIYDPADRVRIVAEYQPSEGYLVVDREWRFGPDQAVSELVEVMYLDPDLELRPSVLDSLRRCFFWETFTVGLTQTTLNAQVNLSELAPWITAPNQVRAVGTSTPNSGTAPQLLDWWRVSRSGKTLTLWTRGACAGSLTVVALRPVHTFVNEELSLTGPNDDLDQIYADLDYLSWAALVELWKNVPERIQPLVHEMLRTDLKACAAEFTKKSMIVAQQMPETFRINFGQSGFSTVGNLAEMAI